jgi:hypothetical protein
MNANSSSQIRTNTFNRAVVRNGEFVAMSWLRGDLVELVFYCMADSDCVDDYSVFLFLDVYK